ncbi:hypothetical protein OPV22_020817 [Ensete ventricosum]|uniref:FAF domain-containing protein n=1 Tax=Ensete ventricosum TaxID=4639 RepID=A0AAV8QHB1_ENSVE|nr:hypothetical protein OPV22_020817 [Ensete ventricosum]
MDPWAELRQILEQPLPRGLMLRRSLSWDEMRSADPLSPALKLLGETPLRERPRPPSTPPSLRPLTSSAKDGGHGQHGDDDGLSPEISEALRPEGDGVGTSRDVEDASKGSRRWKENREMMVTRSCTHNGQKLYTRSHSDIGFTSREGFPPPISTIGRGRVKPWICLKSFKEDGRLVLKKIKLPTCLQATRENGRLLLQLAHPNNKDVAEQEEDNKLVDGGKRTEETHSGKGKKD